VEVATPFRATTSVDVVVMENLFYQRDVERIYDLKGSVRNRYVDPEREGAVLLDENLLELMFTAPLTVSTEAKMRLSWAIYNDARFLASQYLLDYSLLVGVDRSNGALVVGIIDFLTSWNVAKRAEFAVKNSGILGQRGKVPTIVPPNTYAERFRDAMWQYFVLVPEKFTLLYESRERRKADIARLLDIDAKLLKI